MSPNVRSSGVEVSKVLYLDQNLNDWSHITKYVWVFVIAFYLILGRFAMI
jgi:hypothetical protein